MSYCSYSRRCWFTVLDFKSWAFALTAIFSNILLCMCRNGYLWTYSVSLDTSIRFSNPNFHTECEIAAVWRGFHFICRKSTIFPFPVCLTYWFRKYTPMAIISTKFEVCMTSHCSAIAFLLLTGYVTLWPWHIWRVTWPTLPPSWKILWVFVLQLWVITSSTGHHWKCVYSLCACAESCDW